MRLTEEQKAIVDHQGNARVNACAGSGKTSTCLEYIKARPHANILYLAFNATVRAEAIKKFKKAGLNNVTVHTSHSLAYQAVVSGRNLCLHQTGNMRPFDVLGWHDSQAKFKDELDRMLFARHVCNLMTVYCNSDKAKVFHIDYFGLVKSSANSAGFVGKYLDYIECAVEDILNKMWNGKLPITHESYIKKYQLTSPDLSGYTHILFDEAQDTNSCQLSVFMSQENSVKVAVGDSHQSIYGFNGAINSLEKIDFPLFRLSASFRFGEDIAATAMEALRLKHLLGISLNGFDIKGLGADIEIDHSAYAYIARSNVGLLNEAIKAVIDDKMKAAFEGDVKSYSFLGGSASIYDVLNLYLGKTERIRDPFMAQFKKYDALQKYQSITGEQDIGMVMSLVERYRGSLFPIIKEIKEKAVKKNDAEVIFSTVHRSKGLEYPNVSLCKDLINGKKLMEKLATNANDPNNRTEMSELVEEINMLYVAVTRATKILDYDFAIAYQQVM